MAPAPERADRAGPLTPAEHAMDNVRSLPLAAMTHMRLHVVSSSPRSRAGRRTDILPTTRPLGGEIRMERRRLGKTDMDVSVLGFGGSEIGYQRVSRPHRRAPAGHGARRRSQRDRHGRVLRQQRGADRAGGRRAPGRLPPLHQVRARQWLGPRRVAAGGAAASVERSLKRLATDHLDLIQLHSCSLAELQKGDVSRRSSRRGRRAGRGTSAIAATGRRRAMPSSAAPSTRCRPR